MALSLVLANADTKNNAPLIERGAAGSHADVTGFSSQPSKQIDRRLTRPKPQT